MAVCQDCYCEIGVKNTGNKRFLPVKFEKYLSKKKGLSADKWLTGFKSKDTFGLL
tara:strand:+ start:152541 stop:152705 length:165 start_codon:yes stop_codon:yes gene_type:complete